VVGCSTSAGRRQQNFCYRNCFVSVAPHVMTSADCRARQPGSDTSLQSPLTCTCVHFTTYIRAEYYRVICASFVVSFRCQQSMLVQQIAWRCRSEMTYNALSGILNFYLLSFCDLLLRMLNRESVVCVMFVLFVQTFCSDL